VNSKRSDNMCNVAAKSRSNSPLSGIDPAMKTHSMYPEPELPLLKSQKLLMARLESEWWGELNSSKKLNNGEEVNGGEMVCDREVTSNLVASASSHPVIAQACMSLNT